MYKNELDKLLKGVNFPIKALFFHGEIFFSEYYTKLIAQKLDAIHSSKIVYFADYDFNECKLFLAQSSLFGDKNMLIIKTHDNIPNKEIKALIAHTKANIDAYLVVQYYSDNKNYQKDKNSIDSLSRAFNHKDTKDISTAVRFFPPFLNEAIVILTTKAKQLQLDISSVELHYLYDIQHQNLLLSYNELNKFTVLNKAISKEDIKALSTNLSIDDGEKLWVQILEKKAFVTDLYTVLDNTMQETEVLRNFSDFIVVLILFNIYIKDHGFFDSKAILGFKPPKHVEEKRAKLSIKYKLNQYVKILDFLQRVELELKTTITIDKKDYLYASLLKLQKTL